jgi:hypothetical protein
VRSLSSPHPPLNVPAAALRLFAALTVALPGCTKEPAAPSETPDVVKTSWMSATAELNRWNASYVKASNVDGYLVLEGTMWVADEASLTIRLVLRADAGTSPQVIDSTSVIAADITYDPTYEDKQRWSASRSMGSGTFTITSLSSHRATGTFSFIAKALTATSLPETYHVTAGTFDVSF